MVQMKSIYKYAASQIMKVNYKPGGESDADTLVIDPNKKWGTGNIVSSDLNFRSCSY